MSAKTNIAPAASAAGRKKSKTLMRAKSQWQLYLFMLIPVAFLLVFSYYPMLGIQLAFKDFDYNLGMWGSEWIGLDHFAKFLDSYMFGRVLKNTLVISLYGLVAGFPIPIIFALLLNSMQNQKYKKVVQTVTYLPHFISTVVMVGIIMQVLNPQMGIFGTVWRAITGSMAPDIMANPDAFPHLYVWSGIWQSVGWSSIVYVAALSGVDSSLYEAAAIDGAGRFKQVLHIDLPAILPTAILLLIMNAGSIMNVGFEKVFLFQNDLNLRTSEIISTYVYKIGLTGQNDLGYATAIGLFNSVVNFILIVIVNTISSRVSQQSLW